MQLLWILGWREVAGSGPITVSEDDDTPCLRKVASCQISLEYFIKLDKDNRQKSVCPATRFTRLLLGCNYFFSLVQTNIRQIKTRRVCDFFLLWTQGYLSTKSSKNTHFWFLPLKFSFRCRLSMSLPVPLKSFILFLLMATPGLIAQRWS